MEKVCVYGSGNWGTTAARIIAENIVKYPNEFNKTVTFYVHPMDVNGKQLTDIINETHENVKYLPGYKIPENVVATSDINEALKDVTMMVLVVPHQFLDGSLKQIIDCIDGPNGENAKNRKLKKVISLIKGLTITEENIETITQFVERKLNIKASVLSGANVATEIASREFSETTIGYHDLEEAKQWKKLFETDYFLVRCIEDVYGVEVCGALKNIVAVGVGIAEGLG
ncbi:Glycerol-3-phosphate dehydrogenase 1-like protein [Zancudomyces culisetae]|uniref:Glycerol-3-phosphate dehydrogenase [NAD(+)] n=1 Tax=Zancudomyces culisetae TaxID=1213189 RepID=A0A1R1PL70_ZANCU|nr:Glycerol-3-phosphate dehydrogenase 1-like protein [Zancudomyces culisetae]|eukprot:OMH81714.1 Glycerol-3-phosphate dehydrogenase 1-like protein [Zancudomyces culisetae]